MIKAQIFLKSCVRALVAGAKELPVVGIPIRMAEAFYATWVMELQQAQDSLPEVERVEQLEEVGRCTPTQVRVIVEECIANVTGGASLPAEQRQAVIEVASLIPGRVRQQTQCTLDHARRYGTASFVALPVGTRAVPEERANFYRGLLPNRRLQFHDHAIIEHEDLQLQSKSSWELLKLIGLGGFGEVWLGMHSVTGEQRAFKFCQDALGEVLLKKEAKALMHLQQILPQHPNIVRLYGVELAKSPLYLMFEYVPNGTLESLMRGRGAWSWEEARQFCTPIWQALAIVHKHGIVHRDLKPGNIFLDGNGRPKIGDFGIGKVLTQQQNLTKQVRTGTFTTRGFGSAGYASIEQREGKDSHASDDVFALGVILWQMMVGSLTLVPGYPRDIKKLEIPKLGKELLESCIFEPREDRPQDAGAMLELLNIAAVPVAAAQPAIAVVTPRIEIVTPAPAPQLVQPKFPVPELVVLQRGRFLMGGNGYDDEKPIHEVIINYAFAIGKYQVTFEEYDAFCAATKRTLPSDQGWGRGRRPVINVNWDDAQAYCQWLTQQTGQKYRLPTEAEWEYACRAGGKGEYCFGDNVAMLKDYAWYDANSGDQTHPVGEKLPNAWGLYDVHGNVWEWCQDRWHDNYNGAPTDGSAWESGYSSYRLLRGGSWNNGDDNCRTACRNSYGHNYSSNIWGFRVACFLG